MRLLANRLKSAFADKELDQLSKMQLLAPSRRVNRLFGALVFCVTGWYVWSTYIINKGRPWVEEKEITIGEMDFGISLNSTNRLPLIPAKIWQIYLSFTHDSVPTQYLETWVRHSPSYMYGILDATGAFSLVEKISHQPKYNSIVPIYYAMTRRVLRADFLRYLMLAVEGGLYSDIDTRMIRPLHEWVPTEFREKTKLIVGLEADQDPPVGGTTYQVQFCQWTLASAPGHPALWSMIDRILHKVEKKLVASEARTVEYSDGDVLDITGPAGWTEIVFKHISDQAGQEITWQNLTGMREPRLFGDTLVLPIDAFATGVPHSGASESIGDGTMIFHNFEGAWKNSGG